MRKKAREIIGLGTAALLLITCLLRLMRPMRIDVRTSTSDQIWIESPGLLLSFFSSTHRLVYKTIDGNEGVVNIQANFEHQPLIVFCPTNNECIFCVYDSDVLIRLLRIDTKSDFKGFQNGSALKWIIP